MSSLGVSQSGMRGCLPATSAPVPNLTHFQNRCLFRHKRPVNMTDTQNDKTCYSLNRRHEQATVSILCCSTNWIAIVAWSGCQSLQLSSIIDQSTAGTLGYQWPM